MEGSVRCGHGDRADKIEGGLEMHTNRDDGGSSSSNSNSLSERCLREVAKMNFQGNPSILSLVRAALDLIASFAWWHTSSQYRRRFKVDWLGLSRVASCAFCIGIQVTTDSEGAMPLAMGGRTAPCIL
jgi:hypothetical protein